MLEICVYWLLYHLFLWHALFLFRYAEMRMSAVANAPITLREMYWQFTHDYYPVVFCALGTLPIITLDMMKLTHRIAGPLVCFQNVLRELREGKHVSAVKLRKGDLLGEFKDEFNRYLSHLSDERRRTASVCDDENAVALQVDDLLEMLQGAVSGASSGASTSHSPIV